MVHLTKFALSLHELLQKNSLFLRGGSSEPNESPTPWIHPVVCCSTHDMNWCLMITGSEYESDENMDLDEKDDILEQEAGDADDLGPEEDLRNQVHRVHL